MPTLSSYRIVSHLRDYALNFWVPFLILIFSGWIIMIQLIIHGISNYVSVLLISYYFSYTTYIFKQCFAKHRPCVRWVKNSQMRMINFLPTNNLFSSKYCKIFWGFPQYLANIRHSESLLIH